MPDYELSGTGGNVFFVLGTAKSYQKQLKKENIVNKTLDNVLNKYSEMKYDEILKKLESTGLFRFVEDGEPYFEKETKQKYK